MSVFPFYATILHLLFVDTLAYNSLEGFTAYNFAEFRVAERMVYENNKVGCARFVEDIGQAMTIGVYCSPHT